MKIERIDDNSIRCTLTSLDLSSRNINLRDMTYGSDAAKRLFSEMMQKAQSEVGFSVENGGPLMIEAVPLQGGSIQLVISKVDDPEELDTRFSRFSQNAYNQNGWISQLASEILEGAQGLIKQIRENDGNQPDAPKALETGNQGDAAVQNSEGTKVALRIFCFSTLERVMDAASAVGTLYNGKNTLYKDEVHSRYYLVLHSDKESAESLSRVTNLLSEYGTKVKGGSLNEAYYEEHYGVIVKDQALQKLSKV